MRVRITEIRLRPTGKKVRIDREVEVESLFIGRGPDNDLSLKGLTIALHQATLRLAEGRLYVEAASGHEVEVNGLVTNGERLGPGDGLRIGAWALRVLWGAAAERVSRSAGCCGFRGRRAPMLLPTPHRPLAARGSHVRSPHPTPPWQALNSLVVLGFSWSV